MWKKKARKIICIYQAMNRSMDASSFVFSEVTDLKWSLLTYCPPNATLAQTVFKMPNFVNQTLRTVC